MGAQNFHSVYAAFFTMFRCVVSGDCSTKDGRPIFVLVAAEYGWEFGVMYCITVMFMTFGLFNVIVAIYVENTVTAAKFDDVNKQRKRLMDDQLLATKAAELVKLIWDLHNLWNMTHRQKCG